MSNRQTHDICDKCWELHNPGRKPFRTKPEWIEQSPCCFCGVKTESGIFVREDTDLLPQCPGHADD